MIDAYLARLARKPSEQFPGGAPALAEWESRRPRLKEEYLDMLGLWPLPPRTPLHATVTGTVEHEGAVIEKLHFQSRPGLYVTANLYRPRNARGRLPAVLYVCGHSDRGRDGNKTAYQDHGLWFARNGYVCLILDSLQLGEIPGIHHGTYRYGRWWWQARGYTPAGVECWNGMRAVDYLVGRPDVDPDRLAVTGRSGGGAATFWIAAADVRVRCAVPVSGMSDLESYVSDKVINGHCDCMFLVNTYGWDWTTIAAQVAPRPLLFCNSDQDPIFPMDANRRIIARLRQLYGWYGMSSQVDEYVNHGGHADRPELRRAAFAWINRHLKKDTQPVQDTRISPLDGKQLRVFPEDQDIPRDVVNGRVDELFVPTARVALPKAGNYSAWREDLLGKLRARSFRTLPAEVPPARPSGRRTPGSGPGRLTTEEGIEVELTRPAHANGTLVVLNPNEDARMPWLKGITGNPAGVHVLRPRGGGDLAWTTKSPPNYVERAHALLGRTVDQGRVQDVIATVRSLAAEPGAPSSWRVVGRGQAGVLAAYAAVFEPRIREVVAVEPPASHHDGPIFLNVLRVLDVPEAFALLAPRRLTLVHAQDPAFERTARIYQLAGAEQALERR
jgi:dienelactone hydrolase